MKLGSYEKDNDYIEITISSVNPSRHIAAQAAVVNFVVGIQIIFFINKLKLFFK